MHTIPPELQRRFSFAQFKRADLHCHSSASNETGEAMLEALGCPECFSPPADVHAQAKARGMDFVTITDHDTIAGVRQLTARPDLTDVLTGEEVSVLFPEDRCKIHLLVFGINQEQHDDLQARARDVYAVADYLEKHGIAHAVAHPVYRQNDKLERWHLERLLLLFKGFEVLNGAHSPTHRACFEPLLDGLNPAEIARLSQLHDLRPRWPEPHIKARTGGSDDHALLNIGKTWTEFPPEVKTVQDVLQCLREGTCRPGGEAGSVEKLAHAFYSVGVRFYGNRMLGDKEPNLAATLMQTMVGARPKPGKRELVKQVIKHKAAKLKRRLSRKQGGNDALVAGLFGASFGRRLAEHPQLLDALNHGLPPLGEHDEVMKLVHNLNRDVSNGIADHVLDCVARANLAGVFDAVSATLMQQFVLAPYYFALFHQNKERHLLPKLTRQEKPLNASTLKVGLFTDTFDDINGVARFIRDMATQADRAGRDLTVHTCHKKTFFEVPKRVNFDPLLNRVMPFYDALDLNIPPFLEVLSYADRQQYDVIHVSTPGPMGFTGLMAARMLRIPVLMTYHTDFPAYMDKLTDDHRLTAMCVMSMKWFYKRAAAVFSRSDAYRFNLLDLGVAEEALRGIIPGIDTQKFNTTHRDDALWDKLGVSQKYKLLFVGRVSLEKNLPILTEAFKQLCKRRNDVALVIAGDGPYRAKMAEELAGCPVTFLGMCNDQQLGPLYASSDLFCFPSRTDTLGQVVMEAQASGLPCLISPDGGPKEIVVDKETGLILPSKKPDAWVETIDELLNDEPRLRAMAKASTRKSRDYSLSLTFETFWAEHVAAAKRPPTADQAEYRPAPITPSPMPAGT
ncbi:MAG: glycosyltransferase [Phycisphaerae bacterium]